MRNLKSGDTPLYKIKSFTDDFNLDNLYIKDESKNPFGTWKDRKSELVVKEAVDKHVDELCLLTSSNAGFSLAKFAKYTNIKVVSIIDILTPKKIKAALRKICYKVIEFNLSKEIIKSEKTISLARESGKETIWDVTNGYSKAYKDIITEIREKNVEPDYIICPVGGGEGFVGLFEGLKKNKLKSRLIGVTTQSKLSIATKLVTLWTPYERKIRLILTKGHKIIRLSEDEIKRAYYYAKEKIDCEPSAAVVFGIFEKVKFNKEDKIVLINSGKGLF